MAALIALYVALGVGAAAAIGTAAYKNKGTIQKLPFIVKHGPEIRTIGAKRNRDKHIIEHLHNRMQPHTPRGHDSDPSTYNTSSPIPTTGSTGHRTHVRLSDEVTPPTILAVEDLKPKNFVVIKNKCNIQYHNSIYRI